MKTEMTDADQTRQFTFGAPDEEPEPRNSDEITQLRLRKLNRRITLLALLLPLLTALMGVFGYLEIEKRYFEKTDSGIQEVENLEQDVNARLAGFSERLDGADQKLIEQLAAIEKQITVLQNQTAALQKQTAESVKQLEQNLETVQKSVKSIDVSSAVAAVEKEQKTMMANLNQTLKPLNERVESLSDDLKITDARLSEQLAALSDQAGKNRSQIASIQTQTKDLANTQLNRDQLNLELFKFKKAHQIALEGELGKIRQNLNVLSEAVDRLEARLANTSGARKPAATGTVTAGGIREQPLQ